jgi:MinD-like ATPase involved in chromosome partitioning or flagellar assembly
VSVLIGVYTTRAGQTSSYFATCLAWCLAAKRSVILLDCDMEGGTVADLLYLDTDGRSVANCFGDGPARSSDIEAQAVSVPRRPLLRAVPGLHGSYGFEISDCLRRLSPGLAGLDADVVVADLGHPLSHPGLRSPRSSAEAICSTFQRALVVVRDEPALVARSIAVLRAARPPHGEMIICRQRSRPLHRYISQALEQELPDLPVRDVMWRWDERAACRMGDTGEPMPIAGVAEELHL